METKVCTLCQGVGLYRGKLCKCKVLSVFKSVYGVFFPLGKKLAKFPDYMMKMVKASNIIIYSSQKSMVNSLIVAFLVAERPGKSCFSVISSSQLINHYLGKDGYDEKPVLNEFIVVYFGDLQVPNKQEVNLVWQFFQDNRSDKHKFILVTPLS